MLASIKESITVKSGFINLVFSPKWLKLFLLSTFSVRFAEFFQRLFTFWWLGCLAVSNLPTRLASNGTQLLKNPSRLTFYHIKPSFFQFFTRAKVSGWLAMFNSKQFPFPGARGDDFWVIGLVVENFFGVLGWSWMGGDGWRRHVGRESWSGWYSW